MSRKIVRLLQHAAVLVSVLLTVRCIFVMAFVPLSTFEGHGAAIPMMVFNSLRFDFQIAAYVLLLPTVLMLVSLAWRNRRYGLFLHRFNRLYFVAADLLAAVLAGIDLGFYANFNSHINITFFDFFNEGPLGLLQTVWEEYHCVYDLLSILAAAVFFVWVTGRIERPSGAVRQPRRREWLGLIVYVAVLVVCLRGSVWRFPLQIEDSFVSSSKLINDIVPNGIYMLKKAYKEKKNAFVMEPVATLLATYHFRSLQEALDEYTGGRVRMHRADTLTALRQALFSAVPDTLRHAQPNIVIIYSESWSNYLMELDGARTPMLFGMRRHLQEDLLFRNFQSVQNGTVASIENLTVCTPFPRFFASAFRLQPLPTSMALPFNESGYHTEFISGMDMAWENCAESLIHQHFQTIYDKFSILRDYPNAGFNSVGVFDEHLFTAILDQLNAPARKPKMLMAMTTTNHPPFEFPKGLRLPELPDSFYLKPCFAEHDRKVLGKYITGFRYYNKVLADFLDRFKASPAARNTILVITGDHNVRSILDYSAVSKRWERSVPLYIYLPPSLRRPVYRQLTQRWGSHDDILSTLAPFAFRHTHYMKLGRNLLDSSLPDSAFYSSNVEQLLADKSYYEKAERQTAARNLLRLIYFQMILGR
ncbi:MAG: LTA synthase family protein [Prevotella sp.]|nr:LTA synthase family protein [Prevotella sp.]